MLKYDLSLKLKVLDEYLKKEHGGIRKVAIRNKIPFYTVREWIRTYKHR